MAKISQREARRTRNELSALKLRDEARQRSWSSDYPGGTHIYSMSVAEPSAAIVVKVARQLGHAVVVTTRGNELCFHAVRS